jgi:hypothetical protein
MTSRSSERAREQALAALTQEAAEETLPDIDWERLESKVLAGCAIATAPAALTSRSAVARWVPRPPTWSSSPWPMAIAAAAAAALIYGIPAGSPHVPGQTERARAGASGPRAAVASLALLDVGDVAETDTHSAIYDEPGVVRLALAPSSRFEVVANDLDASRAGGGVTVALRRGSLHADVTPRTDGEVFAVEVERTRIAVHGTSFTVSRKGDRVVVDVAHGSVAVGPVGNRGATHGWLVVGPDRAAFSLDGARAAAWLGPAEVTASAAAEPSTLPPTAVIAGGPASRAKRPSVAGTASPRVDAVAAAPSKGETAVATGTAPRVTGWGEGSAAAGRDPSAQEAAEVAAILRHLSACYEKQATAFGVRFFVESSLTLTILQSGAIREGVFMPPLSPTLMTCADKAIGAARFPPGEASRQIKVPVQLSRGR